MRTTWREVDRMLRGIARQRAEMEAAELPWLLEAKRLKVHEHLGYASLFEYLEHATGYTPRMLRDRLRMAEAMASLPEIAARFAAGEVGFSVARSLVQVATAENEGEWLEAVKGCSAEEVVEMVAGLERGDRPDAVPEPERMLRTLRMDVTPATLALLREAQDVLERETGEHLDDDAFLAMLCRSVLAGGGELARPPHQVATTVCRQCKKGWIDTAGSSIAVTPGAVAKAQCDAVVIGSLDGDTPSRATPVIPDATRRLIFRRFHGKCAVSGCRARRYLEIHHIDHGGRVGHHEASNLVLLCTAHHTLHHRGTLHISGTSPDGLVFAHQDGRPYGSPKPEPTVRDDVTSAMRNMGWDKHTTRTAVDAAMTQLGHTATLDAALRSALHHAGRAAV